MKIKRTLFAAAPIFLFGCTADSNDCPEPGRKIDKIDFNTMTMEAFSAGVSIYDNNNGRHINTTLQIYARDGFNITLFPAFDQGKLHLDANGTRVNYTHADLGSNGGDGCPTWTYPGITVKSSDPKVQLVVTDNSSRSKSWENTTKIDTSIFPIFKFSISNDTFAASVKPTTLFSNRRPPILITDDSTKSSRFTSSIDYFDQHFRLSDFSNYSDTSVSEVLRKRYWALISYEQENVVSLSSTAASIGYAKELPDSIAALINKIRASRIPIR